MHRSARREVVRGQGYEVHIVGGRPDGLHDLYHAFLRMHWSAALGMVVAIYLALNTLFAGLYLLTGGIANAAPGSFLDAFFFSIETMGTIGYGTLYPAGRLANVVMAVESVVGIMVVALATGLVFARFSQTRARVAFSSRAVVSPLDGVPSLMVRVGNERRRNDILDATFRMSLSRTTRSGEGQVIYRTVDLALLRERAPALNRSWMVVHLLQPGSPLHGQTPASLAEAEAELTLAVSGTDGTSLQPIHARHTWPANAVVWGARLADMITETPDGSTMIIDLRRFDDIEPTAPTADFPYRAELPAPAAPSSPVPASSQPSAQDEATPAAGASSPQGG
jgi:inward rectifier potassium channel